MEEFQSVTNEFRNVLPKLNKLVDSFFLEHYTFSMGSVSLWKFGIGLLSCYITMVLFKFYFTKPKLLTKERVMKRFDNVSVSKRVEMEQSIERLKVHEILLGISQVLVHIYKLKLKDIENSDLGLCSETFFSRMYHLKKKIREIRNIVIMDNEVFNDNRAPNAVDMSSDQQILLVRRSLAWFESQVDFIISEAISLKYENKELKLIDKKAMDKKLKLYQGLLKVHKNLGF